MTVLYYRGALSSCNYTCPYCPFSKTVDSMEVLAEDRKQLEQFVAWVRGQAASGMRLSIFFNPYGEALVHKWYREAMVELSHMAHIDKVAVQTNLSAKLDWTGELNRKTAAFWATYHPEQTTEVRFLSQGSQLYKQGLSFSVGTVGLKKYFEPIQSMRQALPEDVYLWVNAFKDQPRYYSKEDLVLLQAIDPYFQHNLRDYESLGQSCRTGLDVFFILGNGQVKRCYKDKRVLGHLYRDGLAALSAERPCQLKQCGCYIGYVHMPELPFESIYGASLLERIPQRQFQA
ncbi:STM4011 family radical SAM protein [Paenibacillus agricola]|uniref:Radical SAM protein n=1 Tax=Paenibacillus agricola TaxID=2716264 RepID=A0ABX0J6Q4_9BACL|nr:STM4011 family radical SAM protein [Paenibacillus agricola]NHN30844.1 radical SAM protein [Paenibacillus agricola]